MIPAQDSVVQFLYRLNCFENTQILHLNSILHYFINKYLFKKIHCGKKNISDCVRYLKCNLVYFLTSLFTCAHLSFLCSNHIANSSKKETQEGFERSWEECGRDS